MKKNQSHKKPIKNKTNKKPTIVICYCSTGSGHKVAAESISHALKDICKYDIKKDRFKECNVRLIDTLDYGQWKADGNAAATFYTGPMAPLHDITWRYNFTGRILWGGGTLFAKTFFTKFAEYVKRVKPDAIIATHMLSANVACGARMITKQSFPIISVPTDYETEGLWPHKQTDLFCVATQRMKETLIARRVPVDKIKVTGMPTQPEHTHEYNKKELRKKLKLPQDKQIALAIAGANEPLPYINLRKNLNKCIKYFAQMDWMYFVICTGRDEKYKKYLNRLCKRYKASNIKILGYTKNMPKLMAASDIALTKAGGMSVTECLCSNLPMILMGKSYAQENVNVRYLTGVGAAYHATTYRATIDLLCRLTSNENLMSAIHTNSDYVRKPNAAYDISRYALIVSGCKEIKDRQLSQIVHNEDSKLVGIYLGDTPVHSR